MRGASKTVWAGVVLSVGFFAFALLTAACSSNAAGPRVAFFGDSELAVSRSAVLAAQDGHNAFVTSISGNYGCGLLVDGPPYCDNTLTTQPEQDAFWRSQIAHADARGRPRFVEVELGLNDAGWHTVAELADYEASVERFISWLPAGTTVLWDNLPEMNPADKPKFDAVNEALDVAAAATPSLHIVDLRSAFVGHWPGWFRPTDPRHYNATGQYQFAKVNCEALSVLGGRTHGASCNAPRS